MSSPVALVHDQLEQDGGAERVLWSLHMMFPEAPIFTAVWNRRRVPRFEGCDVRTSWMQRLPGIQRMPRAYAAMYPLAFRSLDLHGFQLIISSTSYFAKGIRTDAGAFHVCYCHSPSNFVWRPDRYTSRRASRALAAPLRAWLKAWDRWAAAQPDIYIANGRPVAERIRRFYRRDAVIVPPPVDRRWFVRHEADAFYLVTSRLVPSKRVDIAIQACSKLNVPLRIVGRGRAANQLRRLSAPTVTFLSDVSDLELRGLYARARALLLCGEEDFGLVPLEAQAAGTPVIAYDAGGAQETVVEGVTGVRFRPQTAQAMADAILRAGQRSWDHQRIQSHAAGFDESHFRDGVTEVIRRHRPAMLTQAPAGMEHAVSVG
jgi:glycosyltransferase involved in cell wall biosynthesis